MKGKLPLVESFKRSMGYLSSQKILKGISAENISIYFRWVSSQYGSTGRSLTYVWKRVKKFNTSNIRSFTGFSVYPLLSNSPGQYILFGKAKWNNDKHQHLMKKLRSLDNEKLRFSYYNLKADGSKLPDHAVGLFISSTFENLLYDNSMRSVSSILSAEALANKMSDVSSCYTFDIRLSN